MSEILISLEINFNNNKTAELFGNKLDKAAKQHDHELSQSIHSIEPIDFYPDDMDINIETIECKNNTIYVQAYSGRIEPPIWFVDSLVKCGAEKTLIREQWDEGGSIHYFIGKKRVTSAKYYGKKDVELTDKEINKNNLFFSKKRVSVSADLVSYDSGEGFHGVFYIMHFVTSEGKQFVYRGNSEKLTRMIDDDISNHCQFSSTFQLGWLDKKIVSFAKRPTKIEISSVKVSNNEIPKFTKNNKEFIEGSCGDIVKRYFQSYQGNPAQLFLSLKKDHIADIAFSELLKQAKSSIAEAFYWSDFEIHIDYDNKKVLMIESMWDDEPGSISKTCREHIQSLNLDFISLKNNKYYLEGVWCSDKIDVKVIIRDHSFEVLLKHLNLNLSKDNITDAYKDLDQTPGKAGESHLMELHQKLETQVTEGEDDDEKLFLLGKMYHHGEGCEKDNDKAVELWKKASELNHQSAMWFLGNLYIAWEKDSTKEELKAGLNYLEKAAALGNSRCASDVEDFLKRYPEKFDWLDLDSGDHVFPFIDTTFWKTGDRAWMKQRREDWKRIALMLSDYSPKKDIPIYKKYFLKGELFDKDGDLEYLFKQPESLFYMLWFHPSWDDSELLIYRNNYLKAKFISLSRYDNSLRCLEWLHYAASKEYSDEEAALVTSSGHNALLFKVLVGDINRPGYYFGEKYIPLPLPKIDVFKIIPLGRWLCIKNMHSCNYDTVYDSDEAIELWYRSCPDDELYYRSAEFMRNKTKVQLALYLIYHFDIASEGNTSRTRVVNKIRHVLDEYEFAKDFKFIIEDIKDGKVKPKGTL